MHLKITSYAGISYVGSDEGYDNAQYAVQEHAWMDEDIMHTWIDQVLPHATKANCANFVA